MICSDLQVLCTQFCNVGIRNSRSQLFFFFSDVLDPDWQRSRSVLISLAFFASIVVIILTAAAVSLRIYRQESKEVQLQNAVIMVLINILMTNSEQKFCGRRIFVFFNAYFSILSILFADNKNGFIIALLVISTILGVIVVGPLITLAVVIYSKYIN